MPAVMSPGHKALHQFSRFNRSWVEASEQCGCFYCCKFFSPAWISRWVDQGKTATCPECCIDAVLPEKGLNRPLTQEILEGMNRAYFFTHVSTDTLNEALLENPSSLKVQPLTNAATLQRINRLTDLGEQLSSDWLISNRQLRTDLVVRFPWEPTIALALGWALLLGAPFVLMGIPPHPWAIVLGYGLSMLAAGGLSWATFSLWPRWRSWGKAWNALMRGRLNHPELGVWVGNARGMDFTPKGPQDLCYKEVEDWVRALPDLQPFWEEWKQSGKPVRQCDLIRFLHCARDFAGPSGPYEIGEPL